MAKRQRDNEDDVLPQMYHAFGEQAPIPLVEILATFKSVDMASFRVAFALHVWQQHQIQIIWIDPKSYLFGWSSNMSIMECKVDDGRDTNQLPYDAIIAKMLIDNPDCKCFLAHIRASVPELSHNVMLYFNAVDAVFQMDLRTNAAHLNDVVENINQVLARERATALPPKVEPQEFKDRVTTTAAAKMNCLVTWDLDHFSRKTKSMIPVEPIASGGGRGCIMTIDPVTGEITTSSNSDVTTNTADGCKQIESVDAMVVNLLNYIHRNHRDNKEDEHNDANTFAPSVVRCSLAVANVYDGVEHMIVYFETI